MCGINGILNFTDTNTSKELIARMNDRLAHRGPNDQGIFVEEGIALGHRRLSIIDLSSAGHQPMFSYDDRYAIIYNGELYNFKELKFDLQRAESGAGQPAYFFKTNSDTEVILAAYMRWGTQCLQRFNGMFAFAIWDKKEKELFIARDRLGIKPLYYYEKDGVLLFSSEIRALLASGIIPKKLDQEVLPEYLGFQTVHAPNTIIQDVKMLLPGNFIRAKEKKIMIKEYWSAQNNKDRSKSESYKATCAKVKELFYASVERRLIADVPFGAFLSGGIDSSAVVSAMSKVAGGTVKTFCVTFEEKEFSEAVYARTVAKKFGTDHHELLLKPAEFLEELPATLAAMDHPSGDGPNSYIVSKATKNAGITMALSGLGGDELFAGYSVFTRMADLEKRKWLGAIPSGLRKLPAAVLKMIKPGVRSDKIHSFLALKRFDFASTYSLTRQVLVDDYVKAILKKEELPPNKVKELVSRITQFDKEHLIGRTSVAEISTYMQNILLRDTDQMSMAHALEVRVPFLDHKLVEYVLSVPDEYKYPSSPKKLLVDSLCEDLPREVIDRPKMGFTLPWGEWMKKELRSFCEEQLQVLSRFSCFDHREVQKLWERFLKDDPRINWSRVWHLVVLGHWIKANGIEE